VARWLRWFRGESNERRAFFAALARGDVNLLDDAALWCAQLVFHLHRFDNDEARSGLNLLADSHLDTNDESRHRRFDDAARCGPSALPREGLDLLRAVVLHVELEALAGCSQRPTPARFVELLGGERPGLC